MSVKATLKVVLQADDTVVAEATDALLWQKVLTAINKGGGEHFDSIDIVNPSGQELAPPVPPPSTNDAIGRLADQIRVKREELIGACSPTTEKPYLHLDLHCWEQMKQQTPTRGPGSYSPIAVAATLLVLWFRASDLGSPTQAQAQAVLSAINVRDKNASRGIKKSEWLQARPGGSIVLNPAKASKAIRIAKSFCTSNWVDEHA